MIVHFHDEPLLNSDKVLDHQLKRLRTKSAIHRNDA